VVVERFQHSVDVVCWGDTRVKEAVDKMFTHPKPVVTPEINEPVVKPIVTQAQVTTHPMQLLTKQGADSAVTVDPREKNPNFAHFQGGYNKCKADVLKKLNDPEKFTRAQLIDFVTNLRP